jgi:hypothetical protein
MIFLRLPMPMLDSIAAPSLLQRSTPWVCSRCLLASRGVASGGGGGVFCAGAGLAKIPRRSAGP